MTTPRRSAIIFIICLGIVSLFADMTYEGSRSILGPYLKDLGAGATQVGIIAGLGEMLGFALRLFSGRLADRTRAYWTLTILGYGLNVIVVPALAFVASWPMAALLIIAERTGKSIRGPARDVLLSEATHEVGHGFGFGLHAAMDQTGAVLGPLLVVAVVAKSHRFSTGFLILGIPALLALASLGVARAARPVPAQAPIDAPRTTHLTPVFWIYSAAAGLLAFGFADFALLAYHFQSDRLVAEPTIPLLYAGAMAMNGLAAVVLGPLFDRFGVRVLAGGILVSAAALPLGFLGGSAAAVAAVLCWGFGLGVQDATLRPGIAQVVSMNKRGTAFGAFNAVYGISWFAGSAAMGLLYDHARELLVILGAGAQLVAAFVFLKLRAALTAARTPSRN